MVRRRQGAHQLAVVEEISTALAYRRNRFYDASTGQFTQQDPIGLGGGANSYGFASGDPITNSDPFGLLDCNMKTGEGCSDEYKRLLRIDKPLEDPGIADPVALAGGGFVGAPEGAAGKGAVRLVSRIGENPALRRIAAELEGELQVSTDRLTAKLAQGNMNPGLGNRFLFNGILEARARDGARVYFRNAGNNVIEILAKSTKATQDKVINVLRQLY